MDDWPSFRWMIGQNMQVICQVIRCKKQSRCFIYILGKQVVASYNSLYFATVFSDCKSVGGDECQMHPMLGRKCFFELFYPIQHFGFLTFVNRVNRAIEFHLTKVDYVIIPDNKHIHLCSRLCFRTCNIPGGYGSSNTADFKGSLNLQNMLPANLFKRHSTPTFHYVGSEIVVDKSGILLIRFHVLQPKKTEIVGNLIYSPVPFP